MKYIWLILCFIGLFGCIDHIVRENYFPATVALIAAILSFSAYIHTPKGY